jgi:hypothetical protein
MCATSGSSQAIHYFLFRASLTIYQPRQIEEESDLSEFSNLTELKYASMVFIFD